MSTDVNEYIKDRTNIELVKFKENVRYETFLPHFQANDKMISVSFTFTLSRSNELRTKEALERRDKLVTERILVEQINKDLEQELESVCREWDTLPQFVSTDHSESWK